MLDDITNLMDIRLRKLWELVWTAKPGVVQSTRLQRVGHDWLTFTSLLIFRERKIKTRVFIKLLDFKRSVPKDVGNLVSSG